MRPVARKSGFTLVEVLVALAVFAILALIGYRTLSGMFMARERVETQSAALRDEALLFARLEADLASLLPRSIQTSENTPAAPLVLVASTQLPTDARIAFTRSGFSVAGGADGAPQRVGYRLREGNLELLLWDGLDQAPRAVPRSHAALSNVREFRLRALDQQGTWLTDWPRRASSTPGEVAFPSAIEVTLTREGSAPVTRLFALPQLKNG